MLSTKQPYLREILLLLGCNTLIFCTMGMNIVIFPTLLLQQGISESLIGFSVTVELIASIVISFFVPRLAKKYSVIYTLLVMLVCYAVIIILLPFYVNFFVWLFLIFILGIALFGAIIISHSLYHQFLENQKRGWYLSLMTIAICLGLSIGPIIVGFIGALQYKSFLISGFFALLSTIPALMLLKNRYNLPLHRHVKFLYFIKRAPIVFISKFTQEFIVTSIFALGMVFLLNHNHNFKNAGLALSAFAASAIVDLGIGYLADRFNKYRLISVGVIGICVSMGSLVFYAHHFQAVLAIFFALGIFAGFMHISLTSLVNNRFPKKSLVSANATLQLIGSSGGIFGALIVGTVMQFYGNYGFQIVLLGVALICFLLTTLVQIRNRLLLTSQGNSSIHSN